MQLICVPAAHFAVINEFLPTDGYAMGAFSIADAALFYV